MGRPRTISAAIRFGFSVGRVRVLEGRLLSNVTLERLLDARSFDEQKRVFADTEYGSCLGEAETAGDVEAALDECHAELFWFLETSRLPETVSRYFRTRYDYANLKARLKSEALNVPLQGMLEPHGMVEPELFGGSVEMLPAHLRVLDAAVRDGDVVVRDRIDPVVDRAMHEDLLAVARESGCRLLQDLAELTVNLANVRTVLRAHKLGWPAADVRDALVPGATVPPRSLLASYGLSFGDMVERLSAVARLSGVGAEDLLEVERFDVLADNLIVRQAKKARLIATGVEPVIGYVMALQSELVILRMLLLGKIAGLSAQALRKRMRELYV